MDSDDISANNLFDRRVAPRYKSEFQVGLEVGFSEFCQCRSINISTTGIRLVANRAIGMGTRTSLTLCLDEDTLVELEGESVWESSIGSLGTHVVGLSFGSGQVSQKRELQRWLRKQGVAA